MADPPQVALPPPLPLFILVFSCLLLGLPRFLGSASESLSGPLSFFARRFSCQQVSTFPPKSIRSPSSPLRVVLARPSVGSRRSHPPTWVRLAVRGAGVYAPWGIWCVPSRGRCEGSPAPYSDRCCALDPKRTCSRRDGGLSPVFNPSETGLPPPPLPFSTSYVPFPICVGA